MKYIILVIFVTLASCSGSSGGGGGGSGSSNADATGALVISGTIENSADTSALSLESRKVVLKSEDGSTVGEAITSNTGSFIISYDQDSIALNTVSSVSLLRISALYTDDNEENEKAVGFLDSFLINKSEITSDQTVIDVGSHQVKKIGAIIGQISLETFGDSEGIDVYIPGSTYSSKTDSDGKFVIGPLVQGEYKVRVDKDGYNSKIWENVYVATKETTKLELARLDVSTGPKIESLTLEAFDTESSVATLSFEIKSASSYRLSTISNFSDVEYKAFNNLASNVSETLRVPVGIKKLIVYLEAVDTDGLTASKTLTIDREAPCFGEISLVGNATYSATQDSSFQIYAEGASYVHLTEDIKNFKVNDSSLSWQLYSEAVSYTLSSSLNGSKKVYAIFKDEAQNFHGEDGSIYVDFILDTLSPNANKIHLLRPESPTGAFNTPLVWYDSSDDIASYEIEVSDQSDFSNIIRSQTVKADVNIWNIDPPLESAGVYHWRLRAIDEASNTSEWKNSSVEELTSFRVVVLGTSLQAQFGVIDESGDKGAYFGRNLKAVNDFNQDGYPEVAYQRFSTYTSDSACLECVAVDIFDVKATQVVQTLSENLDNETNYGKEVIHCDITGDGNDETIISAPFERIEKNSVTYHNGGKIYVYNKEGQKLLDYAPDLDLDSSLINSWPYCRNHQETLENCTMFGYPAYISPIDYMPWYDGLMFGWDLGCDRNAGDKDKLLAAMPGYKLNNTGYEKTGRVDILSYSSLGLQLESSIIGQEKTFFGSQIEMLDNFNYSSSEGSCSGIVLAVSEPNFGENRSGRVSFYQKDSTNDWVLCASVYSSVNVDWARYGNRLKNLGDANGDGFDLLAISNDNWNTSRLEIIGGAWGDVVYHKTFSESEMVGTVEVMGDYNGDSKAEIGIGFPHYNDKGNYGAGKVAIYDISVPGELPDELKTITGLSSRDRIFGAGLYALRTDPLDINSSVEYSVISSPNVAVGEKQTARGTIEYFTDVRFAPSEPDKLVGRSTNEYFGTSIMEFNDIDSDGRPDYLIGAPGARCNGVSYGGIYTYSGLDGEYSLKICSEYEYQRVGFDLHHFDESNSLGIVGSSQIYHAGAYQFAQYDTISHTNFKTYGFSIGSNYDQMGSYNSLTKPDFVIDRVYREDYIDHFLYGEPGRYNSFQRAGRIGIVEYSGTYPQHQCGVISTQEDAMLGTGVSYAVFDAEQWVWGSAPGYEYDAIDDSKKGEVSLLPFPSCTDATDKDYDSEKVLTITASHADIIEIIGERASSGFGNLVLSLGDLDGASGVTNSKGDLVNGIEYVLISNSNSKLDRLLTTPQIFIFRIDNVHGNYSTKLVFYESGESGSMLGGSAMLIEDINGDGIGEIVISHPYGVGRYGLTGNVKIFSGIEIAKQNASAALIQSLFNPEDQQSNFGMELLYADITGDGLKDFIVSASNYSTEERANVGAIYVFPVKPITEKR